MGTNRDGRSVDVELNVVPFIDLMSCLTAFLLVTAVWSSFASIEIEPAGLARDGEMPPDNIPVIASVLITDAEIWVGVTHQPPVQIARVGDHHDYDGLGQTLEQASGTPQIETRVEVAAEDDVQYQAIVNTMDTAIASNFPQIGFVDPASLSYKFRE